MTTTTTLIQADLEAGYDNDEWLGHGYLGVRESYLQGEARHLIELRTAITKIEIADELVLAEANRRGMSRHRFFDWLNSKNGRWTADELIGSPIDADSANKVRRYMDGF